jgi:molybdopterin converting factor subunit 1
MKIRVKLFAVARQLAGGDQVEVELPGEAARVADLRAALIAACPQLGDVARHLMIAVDTEYASDSTLINTNSEVAVIPPVSGG